MNRDFSSIVGLLPVGLIVLTAIAAVAGDTPRARIEGVRVELAEHQVLLAFKLANAFDDNLQRRIQSGLPTGIVFDFELVRARKGWFNKNVDSGTMQVVAMYNAVTREYLINYKHDGNLIESRVVREAEELRAAMTDFSGVPVFSLESRGDERLQVRIRAELGTRTLLFFIPTTLTTEWAESRIFVGGRGEPGPTGE
ncbi:MAG: DUF4390 domain-containing protein [bacterium]|nr:DUF4390 domain-containing protein [bacterium]